MSQAVVHALRSVSVRRVALATAYTDVWGGNTIAASSATTFTNYYGSYFKAPVAGTNNEAERTLRSPAEARETGRTNKTLRGARRRTVIVSVLESLRQYLATFTLSSVIDEIARWSATGRSCFTKLARKLRLSESDNAVLDFIYPKPSG